MSTKVEDIATMLGIRSLKTPCTHLWNIKPGGGFSCKHCGYTLSSKGKHE